MSYQALYRVWRPQTFDELIGQSMISETLKNAIVNGQLSHAYLFTGPRGTGKTSAAKILAKAVNCVNNTDGNPCNQCDMCMEITKGQLSDVIEIDAASNNGVEEIRDLRDNVRYAASQAQYKVYIIDEVHMLTTGAFNALLKTLEEPPERVIFIMATTEPHKIPATILSRTQRFDFQRITPQDLIHRMKQVLDHDKVKYDTEALSIIARAANGGMRDSLSLLDQALSYNNERVSVDSALEVSGSLSQLVFVKYIVALVKHESALALEILTQELNKGKQASRFIEELTLFARDMLLTIYSNSNQTLLSEAELQPLYDEVPNDFYYQLIDALNDAQDKMRFSNQPDLYVEVVTIQLSEDVHFGENKEQRPVSDQASIKSDESVKLNELQDQVGRLEEQLAQLRAQLVGQTKQLHSIEETRDELIHPVEPINEMEGEKVVPEVKRIPRKRPVHRGTAYQVNLREVYQVLNVATHDGIKELKSNWASILSELPPQARARFTGSQPLAAGDEYALISFTSREQCGVLQADNDLQDKIESIAAKQLGHVRQFTYILEKEWPEIRSQYAFLRKKNHNQPVELPEEEQSATDEDSQSHQEEVRQTGTKLAVSSEIKATKPKESITEEKEETPKPISDTVGQIQDNVKEKNTPMQDSKDEEEVTQQNQANSQLVSKAIELFGEENINIYER